MDQSTVNKGVQFLRVLDLKRIKLENKSETVQFHPSFCVSFHSEFSSEKHNQAPHTFARLVNFSINVSAMFDNHTILFILLQNKQTFLMFSVRDLRLSLFISFHFYNPRATWIIGLLS